MHNNWLSCISQSFITIPGSYRSRFKYALLKIDVVQPKPKKMINVWINLHEDL